MTLSRRDLLRGMAGLGLAACSGRRAGSRVIRGSIAGGAHARGHLLRDEASHTPDSWEDLPVAILGAGVAGLCAAWTFEKAGLRDFVILELEDAVRAPGVGGDGTLTRAGRPAPALGQAWRSARGSTGRGGPRSRRFSAW